ncbi:TIGR00730 family Rossman fold protein [Rickettsiales bacterium]|nr:TIGR00730 family Rossman fold protein [Rickettsiales bacterium]
MSLNIGIFCGSKFGRSDSYSNITKKLANWIGKNQYNIIFGGTNLGLMKVLVKEASKYDIKIYGIIPACLIKKKKNIKYSTDLITTNSLEERKKQFLKRSDCFVALPGGIGTLNEILDLLVKKELNEIKKNIYLVNEDGFWEPFILLIKHLIDQKFIDKNKINSLLQVSSLEVCLKRIKEESNA